MKFKTLLLNVLVLLAITGALVGAAQAGEFGICFCDPLQIHNPGLDQPISTGCVGLTPPCDALCIYQDAVTLRPYRVGCIEVWM